MDKIGKHADSKNTASRRCQVAVPVPIRRGHMQLYDYLAGPAKNCPAGTIVNVPLGGREVWGLLVSHNQTEDISSDRLKPVICLADVPALTDETMRFLSAVSRWTLAPFGPVMRLLLNTPSALLPPPLQTLYGLSGQKTDTTRLTPQRARVINVLGSAPPLPLTELSREAGVSTSVIKRLAEEGVLIQTSQPRAERTGLTSISDYPLTTPYKLTSTQQSIADNIDSLSKCFGVHLIDGITGSGKTEVYFDQVIKQLNCGRQVLILLPEIALTSSWKARFEKWFGQEPLIWHSSLPSARRKLIWRQAISGQPMVVAGARSALFLPFSKLSLIVIDEEHDSSYKQEDQVSYQARDMAIMRAKIHSIPVILASATPSLESWIHAGCAGIQTTIRGSDHAASPDWYHWGLTSRYGQANLPKVSLIDLRLSKPEVGKWLSSELLAAITARLEAGEQSLLFLNRRGYAPMTVCSSCGYRLTCHQCDSLLVTHKLAGRYAGALYELAVDAKATDVILSDLTGLKSLMSENDELNSVIESPVYARTEQAKAVMAVLEKAGANSLTIKFVGAVADNGRLFALKQIIQAFAEEVARRNGQISAEVCSAISLDSQRKKVVEDTVAKLAGSKNISLEMKVDPSLLGGLVVRIGSRLFDTSVKTKLNRLEAAMKGVA